MRARIITHMAHVSREHERSVTLRGYFRQLPSGQYLGVCLTLNLVVRADTLDGAKEKLSSLMNAYIHDAFKNNEVDAFVPRRAPLSFYVYYWMHRPVAALHTVLRTVGRFSQFKDRRSLVC